jgi:hypothetical protein
MDIPQKIMDMISIIVLTIQGIVYWIYSKLQETVIRIPKPNEPTASKAGAEAVKAEHFSINTTPDPNNIRNADYDTYKPDDMIASNSNKYDRYSLTNIIPENIILPSNYQLTTNEFEKKNTEYDYKNYSNVDGAGVHLQKGWTELSSINRPWFETCISQMDCKIVDGILDKYDYQ